MFFLPFSYSAIETERNSALFNEARLHVQFTNFIFLLFYKTTTTTTVRVPRNPESKLPTLLKLLKWSQYKLQEKLDYPQIVSLATAQYQHTSQMSHQQVMQNC